MISVVAPFYNEENSVKLLHERLMTVLKERREVYEIIFIDDGSTDGTFEKIKTLKKVRGFRFARNRGQTAAFAYGVHQAKGDTIVTIDGDLENAPEDIPLLLDALSDTCDVAAGWRKDRWKGSFFTRKLPSKIANALISKTTGVELHDHGCCLRAYKVHVFEGLDFRGEMHRMLAAYLGMRGARIKETPVSYVPRKFGSSHYGLSRMFRVLLDVFAFHFFKKYGSRPMHFFGYAGFVFLAFGGITFLWSLWYRVVHLVHFNRTPLPILVAIFVVVGFQFILMGLLAEIFTRSNGVPEVENIDIAESIENK